jgi:multisubunit Na+/H+ antiporter MnhE subunit
MRAWVEVTAWWAVLVLVWLASLNSFAYAEAIVAAVLAVPCALAARQARLAAKQSLRLRARWARWLLRLPWTVVHDTVAMLVLALRPERTDEDDFSDVRLAGRSGERERAGWEAAATTVLSATPGSIVVDAGPHHDRLVVHSVPIPRTSLREAVTR